MPAIEITGITHDGRGVGRIEGEVAFVAGAVPGERVEVTAIVNRGRYLEAETAHVISSSPDRTLPPCPYYEICGGCQLQHVDYQRQLALKREIFANALRGTPLAETRVPECHPSPRAWRYRNKVTLHTEPKEGQAGYYHEETHRLVPIADCQIAPPGVEDLISWWNEHPLQGITALTLRVNGCGDSMLVAGSERPASKAIQVWGERALDELGLASVVVDCGSKSRVVIGEDALHDQMSGINYLLSPTSFAQVNPEVARDLYTTVTDWCRETGHRQAVEAYCGIGVLSLLLAREMDRVYGLEINSEAVEDARANARLNRIDNVVFQAGPCEKTLPEVLSRQAKDAVLVVDPPRAGLSKAVAQAIIKSRVSELIYISCNPATLARDLTRFHEAGYRMRNLELFDMFPQTAHVECVVLITKL